MSALTVDSELYVAVQEEAALNEVPQGAIEIGCLQGTFVTDDGSRPTERSSS